MQRGRLIFAVREDFAVSACRRGLKQAHVVVRQLCLPAHGLDLAVEGTDLVPGGPQFAVRLAVCLFALRVPPCDRVHQVEVVGRRALGLAACSAHLIRDRRISRRRPGVSLCPLLLRLPHRLFRRLAVLHRLGERNRSLCDLLRGEAEGIAFRSVRCYTFISRNTPSTAVHFGDRCRIECFCYFYIPELYNIVKNRLLFIRYSHNNVG